MRWALVAAVSLVLTAAIPTFGGAGETRTLFAGAGYPEGPLMAGETLWFAEMTADRVTRVAADGRLTEVAMPEGCGPTSVARFGDTRLVVLCHLSGGLHVITREGVIVDRISRDSDGDPISYPNDSFEDRRGGVYFSSSGPFNPRSQPSGRVLHLSGDGTVRVVAGEIVYSNGVFVTRDGSTLLVSEHLGHRIRRYRILDDMSLEAQTDLAGYAALGLAKPPDDALTGPDGIEVATDGRIFVAIYGAGKALILSPAGAIIGEIATPLPFLTNITLDEARGRAILTGAYSNTDWPYDGAVIEVPLPPSPP